MLTLLLAVALTPVGCVGGPTPSQVALGVPAQHCAPVRGRSERDAEFAGLARTTVAVLSPDDRYLYATTRGDDAVRAHGRRVADSAIAVYARRPRGGLHQLRGPAGCVTPSGRHGCTSARGIEHVSALGIAPDGQTLYAAANKRGTIAVFHRDLDTGALRQLAGRQGCLGSRHHVDGCGTAAGLANVATLLVSADGRNVYAESLGNSRTFSEFARNPRTGALRPLGCLSLGPRAGGAGCSYGGHADLAFGTLDQSPDGRFVTSSDSYGIGAPVILERARDGTLRRLAEPCRPACEVQHGDPAGRLVIAPEGTQAYELSTATGEIVVWSRDPATGVLSGPRTAYQVPCDPDDCYMGPGAIAFAPDGRTAYVVFSEDGLKMLARDPATGTLSPLACWSLFGGNGCAKARGLVAPEDVLIARDGRAVYAVTQDFAISVFSYSQAAPASSRH
jgi:6-phosphogluconolactonase (cycloisomerase 2 family)